MVKAGELLAFSTGEYSDYSVQMFCRALKDIDMSVVEAFQSLPEEKTKEPWAWDSTDRFQTYLEENGYVERLAYKEVHLGSYGRLDLEEYNGVSPLS